MFMDASGHVKTGVEDSQAYVSGEPAESDVLRIEAFRNQHLVPVLCAASLDFQLLYFLCGKMSVCHIFELFMRQR